MDLMSLVVFLILVGLAFWIVRTLGAAFSIPAPVLTAINVVLVVIVVVYLLRVLGIWSGGPVIGVR